MHIGLGLILILSLWLRLFHLGSRPLYGDESFNTVMIATESLSYITTTNFGSTLYPLLLHFLLPLGQAETMARLPAALFGFLSVWGIFLLGKILFGKKEALLAALFSAVSVYSIYYSQQARGYSGLLFFSILSLYFFWRSVKENKIGLWILYILSTVIGIYTHFFLLIIIPVHASFIAIMIFEKWLRKKPIEIPITKRTIWGVSLSFFFILIMVVLLYLPMRRTETVNFFYFFSGSLTSFFKAKLFLNPGSVIAVIFKKLLDYDTRSWLFFVQLALIFMGCVSSLKSYGKALIMFLLYFSLPFLLFSMSNPLDVYLTPQVGKFIFILPLLFLLMAKGLTSLHSILSRTISKLSRAKNPMALGKGLWVPIVLGILVFQAVLLEDHYYYNWNLLSIKRDREINSYLKQNTLQTEIIYFDEFINKNTFLILQPLRYPDGRQKGVAVIESDYDLIFSGLLYLPTGLVVILDRSSFGEEDISRLKSISPNLELKKLSRHFIVHFPGEEKILYEKMVALMNFLIDLPWAREKIIEYYLLLAKIHLLADRYEEALKEIATFNRMKSQPIPEIKVAQKNIQKLFCIERASVQVHVQNMLAQNIQESLMKKADQLLIDGKFDTALLLQKEVERHGSDELRSAVWLHLSLAESYLKKGMASDAAVEFERALPLCPTPRYEFHVLKKILDIRDLPFGYFIWKTEGIWHLRWWSKRIRTFAGTVESSRLFRGIGAFRMALNDDYTYSRKKVIFRGIVEADRIQGLDFLVKRRSRLTFSLRIKGQGEIQDHIIFLPEDSHPREMPFSVEEY